MFGLNGSLTLDHDRSTTPTSGFFEAMNDVGFPVDFRVRAQLGVDSRAIDGFISFNHSDGYEARSLGKPFRVGAFQTVDLSLGVKGEGVHSVLRGSRLYLVFDNILNETPTILPGGSTFAFDFANSNPFGRRVSLRVVHRW